MKYVVGFARFIAGIGLFVAGAGALVDSAKLAALGGNSAVVWGGGIGCIAFGVYAIVGLLESK